MTNKQLLKYWQKILGLQDWIIDLRDNSIPSDFLEQGRAGEVEWQEVNKTAVIRILKSECYGKRIIPFNFEKTLIHELLHIKFYIFSESENELQIRLLHQLIEDFAKMLYKLRNQGEHKNDQTKTN